VCNWNVCVAEDTDNASFAISGNVSWIAESLDSEAQQCYSARDRGTPPPCPSPRSSDLITAATAAENSAPTELAIDNTAVADDAPVGAVIGTLTANDADAGDTHSYSIVSGEGDTNNASFDIGRAARREAGTLSLGVPASYA